MKAMFNLTYENDELYQYHLGIDRISEKEISYPKSVYNNAYFAYDDDQSIYLVDKLHLSFKANYNNNIYRNLNYLKRSENYSLTKFITFTKQIPKRIEFNQCCIVEVSGYTYCNLYFDHSRSDNTICIEISNEFFYVFSRYDLLDNLIKISTCLSFRFDGVRKYELARDGLVNYYDRYLKIYYQSDFCPDQIYQVYGGLPKYSSYGRTSYCEPIIPDKKNKKYGTAYVGKSESATQLKLYSKERELRNSKKKYIQDIHNAHFGKYQDITRVEVMARRKAIEKNKWDLWDLINPEEHRNIFYTLIGEKLTFKDLETKYWDTNNNCKYLPVSLLPKQSNNAPKIKGVRPRKTKNHKQKEKVINNNSVVWLTSLLKPVWRLFIKTGHLVL